METLSVFNFKQWIDENRHLLKPPVGNKVVWKNTEFIVMVVGGPNARKDYHFNESEEFFYQLEGDITVKVQQDGKAIDVNIKEGDIFLLPPRVPHSPIRGANTIGLVMERKRREGEKDGLLWFCENCNEKLYEEYFKLEDITTQFQEVFKRFYDNVDQRTCKKCGTVMQPPVAKTAES
ncbi:3-hydroxyanthranilate 3,4-dioxygenase [Solitalea koreensis]|uniref:3-hydroxyanthranilate 3,4-dioxygenase n=1 Tax=Solitalea koreensis TaxID=543615 RepID=A0A521BDU6_9SPHI|nr:3-hydroxyanthranilate 3,4-dioxygenase [Solitalea koreensis]SMO45141.1 3-hydroxyanthranilate 3,4-dioxygenase [Solitalea koreensis]